VSAIGLGCMSMSTTFRPSRIEGETIELIRKAVGPAASAQDMRRISRLAVRHARSSAL